MKIWSWNHEGAFNLKQEVLDHLDRLDDRAIDIGALAERNVAAVGQRGAGRRRARRKGENGGEGDGGKANHVLHLPVSGGIAMNAP